MFVINIGMYSRTKKLNMSPDALANLNPIERPTGSCKATNACWDNNN